MTAAQLVDAALEWPIAPSFTRVGFDVRRRLFHWTDLDDYQLSGRVVVITGATSGLGRAAAEQFVRCGAEVVLIGRDPAKTERVAAEITAASRDAHLSTVVADLGELDSVRAAATELRHRFERLDVLIHNAGALSAERQITSDGIEATVASQVVGPFLLTSLLLDRLSANDATGRVLTMSSGGMYAAPLTVDGLEMAPADYDGTRQYALAKRAQVTLNEMWAERDPGGSVVFHAMHPGWADTPGVESSLPTFHKVVGPLLRPVDAGADTMVWLGADDGEPLSSSGGFWLDRHRRPIHRLARTRRSDTPEERRALWDWVANRAQATPA